MQDEFRLWAEARESDWRRKLEPEPDDTRLRLETKLSIARFLVVAGGGRLAIARWHRIEAALQHLSDQQPQPPDAPEMDGTACERLPDGEEDTDRL